VSQDVIDRLNQFANEVLGLYPTRTRNRLVYWNPPRNWRGTVYLFGYTPWRTVDPESGVEGYFAVKYRRLKDGRCRLVKKVRFGRRKVAKARSLTWYRQYYGE